MTFWCLIFQIFQTSEVSVLLLRLPTLLMFCGIQCRNSYFSSGAKTLSIIARVPAFNSYKNQMFEEKTNIWISHKITFIHVFRFFDKRFCPSYDYGYADFDIRHRFVASFNYDIPFARNLSNGFAKSLLDGFSINGILTANTGAPFTIFDCTNATQTTCLRIKPTAQLARSNSNPTSSGANVFTYLDLSNQTPNPFTDVSGGTEVGPFPTEVDYSLTGQLFSVNNRLRHWEQCFSGICD